MATIIEKGGYMPIEGLWHSNGKSERFPKLKRGGEWAGYTIEGLGEGGGRRCEEGVGGLMRCPPS